MSIKKTGVSIRRDAGDDASSSQGWQYDLQLDGVEGSSSGKNLVRFALECLVELTFFCVIRVLSVSICRLRPNLWNFALHLQELKMSELSLIIDCLFSLRRWQISFLSTMHSLHCGVIADFMHLILSPFHSILGWRISLIRLFTSLLVLQSLQ